MDGIEKTKRPTLSDGADPYRLTYHAAPPAGWMNDPNGLVYYNGEVHLFYQGYPAVDVVGPIHWGHMSSKDMLHWRHHPAALCPGDSYDDCGCYSGSAIEMDGRLCLLYTGNAGRLREGVQQICLAESSDGIHFTKHAANPLFGPPPGGSHNFRDPKVWRHKDAYYCVVGHSMQGQGCVCLYESQDLVAWQYRGIMLRGQNQGFVWECPDFFHLDGKDVLVFSPEGMQGEAHTTWYCVGELDYETGRYSLEAMHPLDIGRQFYAPQTFDYKGGRILVGWMGMWGDELPTAEYGWAGAMTLPRKLHLGADGILQQTAVDLATLYGNGIQEQGRTVLPGTNLLENLQADKFELKLAVRTNCPGHLLLQLRAGPNGECTSICINPAGAYIEVDTRKMYVGKGVKERHNATVANGHLHLCVYVDTSSLELLQPGGGPSMTYRIYHRQNSTGLCMKAVGGAVRIEEWKFEPLNG